MDLVDIVTRLAWAAGIVLLGLAVYRLGNRLLMNRAAGSAPAPASQASVPAILYFTTPDCSPCRTIQRPAIERIKQTLGERVSVLEVNAYDQPDLARKWGVLSVPTTFILDKAGKPLHINHGVTRAEKLLKQIEPIL